MEAFVTNTLSPKADSKSNAPREFLAEVMGFSYHRPRECSINIGDAVRLVREPQNKYDPKRIRIELITSEVIGFINPRQAVELAIRLDRGDATRACVDSILADVKCTL